MSGHSAITGEQSVTKSRSSITWSSFSDYWEGLPEYTGLTENELTICSTRVPWLSWGVDTLQMERQSTNWESGTDRGQIPFSLPLFMPSSLPPPTPLSPSIPPSFPPHKCTTLLSNHLSLSPYLPPIPAKTDLMYDSDGLGYDGSVSDRLVCSQWYLMILRGWVTWRTEIKYWPLTFITRPSTKTIDINAHIITG